MNTTMTKFADTLLTFTVKQEVDAEESDDDDDIKELLAMPLPAISEKNFLLPTDPNDEFLRLTTMVRTVYFSYLHKCLRNNYVTCYKEKDKEVPCEELKKCADQLELNAVRHSLAAHIYRQYMLRLISDIKSHTSEKKIFKKLVICLETPPSKVDAAVQTSGNSLSSYTDVQTADSTQNICDMPCQEISPSNVVPLETLKEETESLETCLKDDTLHLFPTNSASQNPENSDTFNEIFKEEDTSDMHVEESTMQNSVFINYVNSQQFSASPVNNEDENSRDSILQHMEDMFCESDDSSDLTTLIEKHSGINKANIDKEIIQMSLDMGSPLINNPVHLPEKSISKTSAVTKESNSNKVKVSLSDYKEMKNKGALGEIHLTKAQIIENKQKQRTHGIWFVERVHQMSKLKQKMTELSLRNYRKHGRVKQKFLELFGESDPEDNMPDSPICIEEHISSCKDRIAPLIVKYLMPFYKKRRIKNRQLFKAVAKHIADMLILENTFPEQDCVSKYIDTYFKNKKFIKTTQDIYL